MKLTAENIGKEKERVRELMGQDRHKLLLRYPFIGSLIMRMDLVAVHDVRLDTCCTDYDSIYADIGFYGRLNARERLHVLAHEVMHAALLHGPREKGRNHFKWNYAADLEVWFLLKEEKLDIPYHLPYLGEWEGLSAEEIYARLGELKTAEAEDVVNPEDGGNICGGAGDGPGFDVHGKQREGEWDDGEGDGAEAPSGWAGPLFDPDYRPGWDGEAVERARGRVVAAAQHVQRMQGRLPGHLERLVEANLRPQIRWQDELAQFVTSCFGGERRWLPPNRRYVGQGLYLQSRRTQRLRAAVAVDTSGSTQGDLAQFFTELTSLLKTFGEYEITLIYCDAEVQKVEHYDHGGGAHGAGEWEAHGGGGTSLRPPFEWLAANGEEDVACLIYLTDGYGEAPKKAPGYPVLWVLTEDGVKPAEYGVASRLRRGDECTACR